MIERVLNKVLRKASQKSAVISVTGPRQSGKTTLVRAAFPEFHYINLEDLSLREFATSDPLSFLKTYGNQVILDEVQHVSNLFSYIQLLTDENKEMRFILTGSQNLLLHHKISQSLSGRVSLFSLLPFSVSELRQTSYAKKDYEDYFLTGFYPRIYDEERDPVKWLSDYIQTYLERDVRQISNIIDLHRFQQFLKLCAGHIGQLINFSSFGNALGISYHTAQNWLSALEASYIVFRLYPYHQNFNKRLVKTPKLYFYDTGLASVLLGLKTKEQIHLHFAKGMLFENLIIAELMKNRFNEGFRPDFYFWRDNIGNEVDLIIDEGVCQKAIEIKSSRVVNAEFFKGLDYWSKLSGTSPENLFLVYGGNARQNRSNGMVVNWNECSEIIFK
ncbi:MAG: ATP-binding protein [Bacteroidetes bacterium]|nr:ATP-binding protein [Bacteroidota bacterium]